MSLTLVNCGKKVVSSPFLKRVLLNHIGIKIIKNEQYLGPFVNLKRSYATEPIKNKLNQEIKKKINSDFTETEEDEKEFKRENYAKWRGLRITSIITASTVVFLIANVIFVLVLLPVKDEFGNIIEDEFSNLPLMQQFFYRLLRGIDYINKMTSEPHSKKLLPDLISTDNSQIKYTVLIELKDVLIHPDWTYQTGWRFKKRPEIDTFLEMLSSPMFELVICTNTEYSTFSQSFLEALDPNQYIQYNLGKECTQFSDGHRIKNLDYLNRDLRKVIAIDWDEKSLKLHRNNAIILPPWTGQEDDKTLIGLAMLLRTIAASEVEDVRDVLSYYSQFENPIQQFKENQKKLLEQMKESEEIERKKKEPSLASKWANAFLKFK